MKKTRKLRILVAKSGLDAHDFGVRMVALAFCYAGFEVVYTGCRQTPEQIVYTAVQEDVDLIGLSTFSGMHSYSFPRVLELLRRSNAEDIPVVVGGIIAPEDVPGFKEMGITEIFQPDAKLEDIIDWVNNNICPRREILPANGSGRRHAPAVRHGLEWDAECIKKMREPACANGRSLLNPVIAKMTLAEMAWYFEPSEMEQIFS